MNNTYAIVLNEMRPNDVALLLDGMRYAVGVLLLSAFSITLSITDVMDATNDQSNKPIM